ncbi:hypothetical protein BOSP111201_04940 [Bordetella sputigena]|uniref:DUF4148 domain-containing protein n=1 Tax=Bordetella sputigena TaxID=1416810 RepID=UPI0039F0A8BD
MKIKTIATAVILSFAAIGAAQAQTPRGDSDNQPFQGTYGQGQASVSRAQVLAELDQARSAGLTGNADIDNAPFAAQQDSGVTRAQVAADIDHANSSTDIAFGDIDNQPFQGA